MCDTDVAIGATCNVTCTSPDNNVSTSDERCFTCPEGSFGDTNECADCGGARRCADTTDHLLCHDNSLVVNSRCTPSTQQDSTCIVNNHVVKCADTHFASGEVCGECPTSCALCTDGVSPCSVCTAGTSLTQGGCVEIANATAQAHNGAVACDDAFVPDAERGCVLCSSVFAGCARCSAGGCLSCAPDSVFENGVCRRGAQCGASNGTACTSCVEGAVPLNATDCAPAGGCVVYEDGRCVMCAEPLVPLPDGTCAESGDCTVHNGGVCLRCGPGNFADANGICQCLSRFTTHTQHVTRRAQRVHSTRRSVSRAMSIPGCS